MGIWSAGSPCSSVQLQSTVFCFLFACWFFPLDFALGSVISRRKQKTEYNSNRLRVGLKHEGQKYPLLTVIQGDVNFCLNFLSLLSDRDKASKDIFIQGMIAVLQRRAICVTSLSSCHFPFVSAWHKLTESLKPSNTNIHTLN